MDTAWSGFPPLAISLTLTPMPKAQPKQAIPKGAEIPASKREEFWGNLEDVVKVLRSEEEEQAPPPPPIVRPPERRDQPWPTSPERKEAPTPSPQPTWPPPPDTVKKNR